MREPRAVSDGSKCCPPGVACCAGGDRCLRRNRAASSPAPADRPEPSDRPRASSAGAACRGRVRLRPVLPGVDRPLSSAGSWTSSTAASRQLSGRKTRFGAVLDSTLDRYSEFRLFAGLIYYFRDGGPQGSPGLAFFGSMMVSYTRARAEGLGIECRVGLAQRPDAFRRDRDGRLSRRSSFQSSTSPMALALGAIALFANITAGPAYPPCPPRRAGAIRAKE